MSGKSGVSLNWGGLDRVVDRAGKRLAAQRRNLLNAVGETLVDGTLERFEKEVDPEGKKWEPSGRAWERGLARKARKATDKRKAVKGRRETGHFGKTLQDTGRLRSSIDYAVTQDGVLVGSNVEYARIHQEGGKAGRGRKTTIPARPYLGISKEDREEVEAVIAEYMQDCFKE